MLNRSEPDDACPSVLASGLVLTYQRGSEQVRAIRGVDFAAREGELCVIRGASGSGKTSLLNLLAGIETPDEGRVRIGSVVVSDLDETERASFRLQHLGMVFQDHNLISEFSAVENVELPLLLLGRGRKTSRKRAISAIESVGLANEVNVRPAQLSGGQRQRVGIARALVGQRSVILADEPTGSVDSSTAASIFQLLRDLAENGRVVVLVTHDERARAYAHRVLTMTDGTLNEGARGAVEDGSNDDGG